MTPKTRRIAASLAALIVLALTAFGLLRVLAPKEAPRGVTLARAERGKKDGSAAQTPKKTAAATPRRVNPTPTEANKAAKSPEGSFQLLTDAARKRDWDSFKQYVNERSIVRSLIDKASRKGYKGPGGSGVLPPALQGASRAEIEAAALEALRAIIAGDSASSGIPPGAVDSAVNAARVTKVEQGGGTARVTVQSGKSRAVLRMKRSGGRWEVTEVEDYSF